MSSWATNDIWPVQKTYARRERKKNWKTLPPHMLDKGSSNSALTRYLKHAQESPQKAAASSSGHSTILGQMQNILFPANTDQKEPASSGVFQKWQHPGHRASTRPIKSPRFGPARYKNVRASQVDSLASSQENTDYETQSQDQFSSTQNSIDASYQAISTDMGTAYETRASSQAPVDDDAFTNTFTYVSGTSQSDLFTHESIEQPRRQPQVMQERIGAYSPIEIIPVETAKEKIISEISSPTIEYATYWTQPANRFRLSSTLMNDSEELDIHRALPMPELSAVPENNDIVATQKLLETTPLSKTSQSNDRPNKRRAASIQCERMTPPDASEDSGLIVDSHTIKPSVAKAIDFEGMSSAKDIDSAGQTLLPPKMGQMKMTSTPVFSQEEAGSNLQDFSAEISEIPRGNSDLELDVEMSRFVNSAEIECLSQDEEPLSPKPIQQSSIAKICRNLQLSDITHQNPTTIDSHQAETGDAKNVEAHQKKDLQKDSNSENKRKKKLPSDKVNYENKKSSNTKAAVLGGDRKRAIAKSQQKQKQPTPKGTPPKSKSRAVSTKSQLRNSTQKHIVGKIRNNLRRSSKTVPLQEDEATHSETLTIHAKRPPRISSNRLFKRILNTKDVPDDVLTLDEFPEMDRHFPQSHFSVKWVRPLSECDLLDLQSYPHDILESSDEHNSED